MPETGIQGKFFRPQQELQGLSFGRPNISPLGSDSPMAVDL